MILELSVGDQMTVESLTDSHLSGGYRTTFNGVMITPRSLTSRSVAFTAVLGHDAVFRPGNPVIYDVISTNCGNDFHQATGQFRCKKVNKSDVFLTSIT